MAHRSQYWSNTKFAGWIRGTEKPHALTGQGWEDWHKMAKTAHAFRYWVAEEALDAIQNFIYWPVDVIYSIKYYINNRWVTRTHALTAHPRDIPRGEWRDVGNRFLPCLFNELVDFVEIELAWSHINWNEDARERYKTPFWAWGWFRTRTWRCAEAGLDSLEWQRRLTKGQDGWNKGEDDADDPTPQAVKAQEILDLYNWWTQIYPNRPDPYDASGWSACCEEERAANPDAGFLSRISAPRNKDLAKRMERARKLMQKIEAGYEKEDTDMMIRLIRVRHGLWT